MNEKKYTEKELNALTKKDLVKMVMENQNKEPQEAKVAYRRDALGRFQRSCPRCGDVVCVSLAALPHEKFCRYCGVKFKEEL